MDAPSTKPAISTNSTVAGITFSDLDIFENLGSQEFKRIRIGIDHPGDKKKVNKYVIQKGKKEEKIDRLRCIDKGLSVMEFLFQEDWDTALNKLNN